MPYKDPEKKKAADRARLQTRNEWRKVGRLMQKLLYQRGINIEIGGTKYDKKRSQPEHEAEREGRPEED